MSQIGKYRLSERIGAGAMGEVYRAHDTVLDRPVALKIIIGGDDDKRQRFRREAQSAARLAHPNIVTVHDFGEDSGRFFMAMELLDGHDLKRAIAGNVLPDLQSRLAVMDQICDAVAFAHAVNIVHRDLKPANIFLMPNGQVKILDFGLARIGQSSMTGTGMILGTPNYMAPEQIKGSRVDARADVFALGTVFYEILAGRKAFEGESLHSVLYKVLQFDPPPLSNVPSAVAEIVQLAMVKDPAQRYQRVVDMRDAVRGSRGVSPDRTFASTSMPIRESLPLRPVPAGPSSATMMADDVIPLSADVPVTFAGEPGGDVTIQGAHGKTILEIALDNGISHAHACGGHARCSTCRVAVLAGGPNLSPRNSDETKLAKRLGLPDDVRLACQTRIAGPLRLRRLIRDEDDVSIVRADGVMPATSISGGGKSISATGSSGKGVQSVGSEMPLAVLHAQVRETSTLFKKQLAHDVVHILNRYYLQVGDAIAANAGHIARYDGTTMVALFGIKGEDARTKCTNAIRAALRMQKRMATFNGYLNEHFGSAFTLDVGLHYGRMIVGHLGHPDHARLTAVGEPANVAAAVAAANPYHQANVLATEELVNVVEEDVRFGHVAHQTLSLRDRELTVYEILDFAKPDVHTLVQQSFEAVAAQREKAAAVFYDKLFQIAPEVRQLFARVDIRVQGEMLMNMLAAAVRGLDRLDELKPALQELGRRHAGYGVTLQHYAMVEACLLHTVEAMSGSGFNLDVKLAWTAIYNFIAQTMIEASLEAA